MKGEPIDPSNPCDDHCVDCGAGVSPYQADLARTATYMSRALGDSRNRDGFVLCRSCLDRETRPCQATRQVVNL